MARRSLSSVKSLNSRPPLTSSDSPRDRNLATDLGATRFLRKPSNLEQFMALGETFKELIVQSKAKSNGV